MIAHIELEAMIRGREVRRGGVRIEDRRIVVYFFFQAEDGIRDYKVTGVQTCALPIYFRPQDVDLVVPHQANLRIIEAVARRTRVPLERVYVNIQRYGNMSAATVPVALCEALEEQRVRPGALLLMPGFGGGLSYCAHLVRWGRRTTPFKSSRVQFPANERSALQIVRECLERKTRPSQAAPATPFAC